MFATTSSLQSNSLQSTEFWLVSLLLSSNNRCFSNENALLELSKVGNLFARSMKSDLFFAASKNEALLALFGGNESEAIRDELSEDEHKILIRAASAIVQKHKNLD